MQYEIETTEIFDKWLQKLKDRQAVIAIAKRLGRVRLGNLGDISPVGGGVSKMRFFIGPGYRLYYVIQGKKNDCHAVWWRQTEPRKGYKKSQRNGKRHVGEHHAH